MAVLLVVGVTAAGTAAGGPGELDSGFGTAGVSTIPFQHSTIDVIHRLRGDLVVGAAGPDMAVANSSGYWGSEAAPGSRLGRVLAEFGRPSVGYDLASGLDGEQIAIGSAGNDFALAAFDGTGSPVRTFGNEGLVTTSFGEPAEARAGVTTASQVLLFGTVSVGGTSRVAVAGYGRNGVLDPAVGRSGTATLDLSEGSDVAMTAIRAPEGALVAGRMGAAAFVARFLPNGALDATFATGGVLTLDLSPGDDVVTQLLMAWDGRVYFAGGAGDDAVVGRLGDDRLDDTFGEGGVVRTRLGSARANFADLTTDPGGKLLAVGTVTSGDGRSDVGMLRLEQATGAPDPTFGVGGQVVDDLGPADERAVGVYRGYVESPRLGQPLQWTFDVAAGDGVDVLVEQYRQNGEVLASEPRRFDLGRRHERIRALALQGDGRIVVAGGSDGVLLLARMSPNGALDGTFRPGRWAVRQLGEFRVFDVRIALDGGILVLGTRGLSAVVARFTPVGELDLTFGQRGVATLPGWPMPDTGRLFVLPDGSLLATPRLVHLTATGTVLPRAGDVNAGPSGYAAMDALGGLVYVAPGQPWAEGMSPRRWRLDGSVDPAYFSATSGRGVAQAIAALPDGRTVVAGYTDTDQPPRPSDQVLVAFLPDGHIDTSFGVQGVTQLDIASHDFVDDVVVLPDGRILVVGSSSSGEGEYRLVVSRYFANGGLDRSFANGGVFVSGRLHQGHRAHVLPGGSVLVAGQAPTGGATVLRLTPEAPAAHGVRTWGWNGVGQVGDGSTVDRPAGAAAAGITTASAVTAGAHHSLAVRTDGTVSAWGWNALGQLGDGTTLDRRLPVRVSGLSSVTAVAAGSYHSLALRSDGTVWAWGWNGVGQLGDGTTVDRRAPVRVPGVTNVVAIAAGSYHSLALRADGSLLTWGWNATGQLGDGTLTDRHSPVVAARGNYTAIAAGPFHSLGVSHGAVYGWGWNAQAHIGRPNQPSPHAEQVLGLPAHAVGVAAGGLHSLAVLTDGSVWGWGSNAVGQLGDGTTVDRIAPVRVVGLSTATALAAGTYHSVSLLRDGSVRSWGWNILGQLGDGTTVDRPAPVVVAGLGEGRSVAAGILHSVAS